MKKVNVEIQREQIIEAVFSGTSFEKVIQHRLNEELMMEGEDYSIELADNVINETEISNLKFKKNSSQLTEIVLKDITPDSSIDHIREQKRKYAKLLTEKNERLSKISSNIFHDLDTEEDTYSLINYSNHCLCKLVASAGIEHDLPEYNINFGFHAIENKKDHSYLKYYSTIGWRLNPVVSEKLKAFKDQYSQNDSNAEFILKLVFILSHSYSNLKKEEFSVSQIINQDINLNLSDLDKQLEKIIETAILNGTEKSKWNHTFQKLQSLDKEFNFESLLQAILLIGDWRQVTSIGYYPALLKKGEQIITNKFKMNAIIETDDEYDIWNYIVVTTIEDLFLANERLQTVLPLQGIQELGVFLIARPILFEGTPLGDFFISGSYDSNVKVSAFNDAFKNVIKRTLSFIQKEIEQLLRHIFAINMLYDSATHFNIYETNLISPIKNGSTEDEKFWKLVAETFGPIKKLLRETERKDTIQKIFHNVKGDANFIRHLVESLETDLSQNGPMRDKIIKLKTYTDKLSERMEGMYSVLLKLSGKMKKEFDDVNIKELILKRMQPYFTEVAYDSRVKDKPDLSKFLTEAKLPETHITWIETVGIERRIKVEQSFDLGISELIKNSLRFCNNKPIKVFIDYNLPTEVSIEIRNGECIEDSNVNLISQLFSIAGISNNIDAASLSIKGLGMINASLCFRVCDINYEIVSNKTEGETIQKLKIKS